MSVTANHTPVYDLYSGEQDSQSQKLPIGIWKATGTVTGDNTGGYVRMNIVPATTARNKFLWSWEEYNVGKPYSAIGTGLIIFNTGEVISGALSLLTRSITIAGLNVGLDMALFPSGGTQAFVRIANPDKDTTPVFSVVVEENVNLAVYTCELWGYLWYAGSRKTAGGPARPM